jgi:hypothetical protein
MSPAVVALSVGMLVSGSLNTLLIKYQVRHPVIQEHNLVSYRSLGLIDDVLGLCSAT